jgi:ankyrin repeat protein
LKEEQERLMAEDENYVSSLIHNEARVLNWDKVLELCQTHPKHAQYAGADGWTALHHACNRRCVILKVYDALVKAYPGALLDLSESAMTPLHYACRFKAPAKAVRTLVHMYPELGHLAVSLKDKRGRTPLYYAVRYDAPPGVVEMLLEVYPEAVLEEDKAGESPLKWVWDSWAEKFDGKKVLAPLVAPDETERRRTVSETRELFDTLCRRDKRLRVGWETATRFLRAYFGFSITEENNGKDHRTFRMLHATSAVPCHLALFLTAKALYPEQASEIDHGDLRKDGNQQTVLHFAASSSASGEVARTVLTSLLELSPDAAKFKDSRESVLPLHHMVENEHKIHWIHDGIRDVYQAYPAAVKEPDSMGRLPLHRAAAADSHGGGAGGSVILQLLESWPESASQADASGRLALHHLAENGQSWKDEAEAIYQSNTAAVRVRAGPEARLPLHLAAGSLRADHSMIAKLVELNPRATRQTDRSGKLPLHLACETDKEWKDGIDVIHRAFEDAVREPEQNSRHWVALQIAAASPSATADLISHLVELYSEAAEVKDANDRYALHWASDSGKKWDTGLKDIFRANPLANICEDKNGMLPFHIAVLRFCSKDEVNHLSSDAKAEETISLSTNESEEGRSPKRSRTFEDEESTIDKEASEVEVLYQLLLEDPTILPKYE